MLGVTCSIHPTRWKLPKDRLECLIVKCCTCFKEQQLERGNAENDYQKAAEKRLNEETQIMTKMAAILGFDEIYFMSYYQDQKSRISPTIQTEEGFWHSLIQPLVRYV